jgi:hypothetical protein
MMAQASALTDSENVGPQGALDGDQLAARALVLLFCRFVREPIAQLPLLTIA